MVRQRMIAALICLARRLFCGWVAVYVGTSLCLGGTGFARPVCWCLCGAMVVLLGGWQLHRRIRRGPIIEIVAFNIALTLVLGELALRGFAVRVGVSPLIRESLESYRLQPGRDYGLGLHGNRLGYPGRDFDTARRSGIRRIAALGDSFAVGPAVPYGDNYLSLLETALPRTEVYNFGVSGTGPREYLTILRQDVWAYHPDFVLVSVFVGNDITEWLATPRDLDPRQSSLYLLARRGGRLVRDRARRTTPAAAGGDRRLDGALSEATFREVEGRRLAVCLNPPSPSLEKKWTRALGSLEEIRMACAERHVPLAVVLIPDEFQVNPVVRAEALAAAGFDARQLDWMCPQRRLQTFFDERQVPCLDLLPRFAAESDTYAPRDTHWNRRGNHLAATVIAEWLGEMRIAEQP